MSLASNPTFVPATPATMTHCVMLANGIRLYRSTADHSYHFEGSMPESEWARAEALERLPLHTVTDLTDYDRAIANKIAWDDYEFRGAPMPRRSAITATSTRRRRIANIEI